MAELLDCRVCSGKVSSDAAFCPHCGSPNYKPDWYLQRIKREQENQARAYQARIRREQGPELLVTVQGDRPRSPDKFSGWWDYVCFDGKRFGDIASKYEWIGSDSKRYTHLRLTPGHHTVTFEYFQGKSSSQTFTTGETSTMITLYFRKNLFMEKYTLESVTVS